MNAGFSLLESNKELKRMIRNKTLKTVFLKVLCTCKQNQARKRVRKPLNLTKGDVDLRVK